MCSWLVQTVFVERTLAQNTIVRDEFENENLLLEQILLFVLSPLPLYHCSTKFSVVLSTSQVRTKLLERRSG